MKQLKFMMMWVVALIAVECVVTIGTYYGNIYSIQEIRHEDELAREKADAQYDKWWKEQADAYKKAHPGANLLHAHPGQDL